MKTKINLQDIEDLETLMDAVAKIKQHALENNSKPVYPTTIKKETVRLKFALGVRSKAMDMELGFSNGETDSWTSKYKTNYVSQHLEEGTPIHKLSVEIKGLLTTSAMAKIKIGELLNDHKEDLEHGETEAFYNSIGLNKRTCQTYMKYARNPKLQKMKKAGKLDGMTMEKIKEVTGIKKAGSNNGDGESGEYTAISVEAFGDQYKKETSRKILRAQYGVLSNRVAELEKELAGYRQVTA